MKWGDLLSGIRYGRYEKIVHMVVSATLTLVVGWLLGIMYGIAIALVIGIMKEVFDSFRPNDRFDMHDIAANVIGIGIGSLVVYLAHT